MKFLRLFTIFLISISFIASILPLFRASFWWIRIFDYPQLQVFFVILISIILVIICWGIKRFSSQLILFFLLLALLLKTKSILKYTPLSSVGARETSVKDETSCLKVFQANVKMSNKDAEELKQLVKSQKPDILLLTEPNKWWHEQLSDLYTVYPYFISQPQENTYGMILFSRFPLLDSKINFMVNKEIPSIFTSVKLPNGQSFDLYCLHPEPPKPGTDTYERDAELLLVGKIIKKKGNPAIVVGDLNDVAWSYTSELFQRYSELLDPREGRGLFNTYNANIPLFRYPLDHFFYSEDFGLVQLQKLPDIGSDHFPIMMEVCMETEADYSKNKENIDKEDIKDVNEKIDEGLEK